MTTTAMTDTARFQIFMSNWLEDVKEAKYLSRLSYEDLEHTFRHRTESRCILAPNNVCHYEVINEGGFEYDIFSVEARPRSLDLEETARLLTAGNAEGLALDCRIEPGVDEFRAALRGDSPGLALGRRSEIESDRSKSGLRWTTRWLYLEEADSFVRRRQCERIETGLQGLSEQWLAPDAAPLGDAQRSAYGSVSGAWSRTLVCVRRS